MQPSTHRRSQVGSPCKYAKTKFRRRFSAVSFTERTFIAAPRVEDSPLETVVKCPQPGRFSQGPVLSFCPTSVYRFSNTCVGCLSECGPVSQPGRFIFCFDFLFRKAQWQFPPFSGLAALCRGGIKNEKPLQRIRVAGFVSGRQIE